MLPIAPRFKPRNLRPQNQHGNVLFLILIAVALFGALSFAVTQSMRSSGGSVPKETAQVNAAAILSVPPQIRTATQRLMISKGIDAGSIVFLGPYGGYGGMSAQMNAQNVFHPTGGAMPYPEAPRALLTQDSIWAVNSENEVLNIGTDSGSVTPDINSVDIIAFLPHLKKDVCLEINSKLGVAGIPVSNADFILTAASDPPSFMENGGAFVIGLNGTDTSLVGKPSACFESGVVAGIYVFYAVIIER